MDRPPTSVYPAAVPTWLVGERPVRVLDLGSGRGTFARLLRDAGHDVFAVDSNPDRVAELTRRLGTGQHVAARVEALPFLACDFDVVTASQTLHRFAPGLALAEIARVLKPGGHLAVAYSTRDETVPWVRRLIALLRQADPTAAPGDYGVEAIQSVIDSQYFGEVEQQRFRHWVPITRPGLLAMVQRSTSIGQLDPDRTERLLREVADIYDSSARSPEPLLLPFRASCWRAVADHSQLAAIGADDALSLRL